MAQPEFGATAWGRAWLRTIERTQGMPNPQLPQARSLARQRKATLTIDSGFVTAVVADGSSTSQVSIRIEPWSRDQAASAAAVIPAGHPGSPTGDLADGLADTLTKAVVPLAIPLDELGAACTCRARARPCAHILTTVYGLVLLVDERPRLALELRGHRPPTLEGSERNWIEFATLRADEFYTVASG